MAQRSEKLVSAWCPQCRCGWFDGPALIARLQSTSRTIIWLSPMVVAFCLAQATPRAEAYRRSSARGGYEPRRNPRIRSPPRAALIAFRIAGHRFLC
jgi:hypothetical protein